jgi:hypothetical protein
MWGNPYLRILRSQLEKYIGEQLGTAYPMKVKNQTELRKVKKKITWRYVEAMGRGWTVNRNP